MSIPFALQHCNELSMLENRLRELVSTPQLLTSEDLVYLHALVLRISEEFHLKHHGGSHGSDAAVDLARHPKFRGPDS